MPFFTGSGGDETAPTTGGGGEAHYASTDCDETRMSIADKRPSREASGDLIETREKATNRPERENSGQVLAQFSSQDETTTEELRAQVVTSMPTELMQMIFCFVDSKTLLVAVPAVCKLWRYHCAYTRVSVCVDSDGRWG